MGNRIRRNISDNDLEYMFFKDSIRKLGLLPIPKEEKIFVLQINPTQQTFEFIKNYYIEMQSETIEALTKDEYKSKSKSDPKIREYRLIQGSEEQGTIQCRNIKKPRLNILFNTIAIDRYINIDFILYVISKYIENNRIDYKRTDTDVERKEYKINDTGYSEKELDLIKEDKIKLIKQFIQTLNIEVLEDIQIEDEEHLQRLANENSKAIKQYEDLLQILELDFEKNSNKQKW